MGFFIQAAVSCYIFFFESVSLGHDVSSAHLECGVVLFKAVAPVAYQVILGPGIGQFREFEFPRVHTRINSWGLFLVHKFT